MADWILVITMCWITLYGVGVVIFAARAVGPAFLLILPAALGVGALWWLELLHKIHG